MPFYMKVWQVPDLLQWKWEEQQAGCGERKIGHLYFGNLSLAMRQMNGKDDRTDIPLYPNLKSSLLDRNLFRRFVNASQAKPAGRPLLTV